ncbi:hypothetical protein [Rhizobium sp. CNPSo 4039]|uniref:ribbon-helix-helix protein n=1 Tax=Rhizobium sp. CNPSo 4039 TaxID=3021409 RepID=UPI00254F8E93|nr:hypothetical protein [Rhizobium sp. CNPSo 4039]MDK4713258.1 hypothetical protein [Rhizobium sp. CNPSo 4039]
MTATPPKRAFVARPSDAETWIRSADAPAPRVPDAAIYTARLTIDVTPDQRARIKIAAFQRGVTVADMLRELLAREFPQSNGDAT